MASRSLGSKAFNGLLLASSAALVGFVTPIMAAEGVLLAKEEVIGDDGYNKTYNDEKVPFKERMKDARSTPEIVVDNSKGGFGLSVLASLGAVYDAEPETKSGTGFGLGVEPSFTIQSDSWSRYEIGLLIGYNSFSYKTKSGSSIDMTPLVFSPRFGWGHSIGNNAFGMVRLGFGVAQSDQTIKGSGNTLKLDATLGQVVSLDYDLVYGADTTQFFGGLGVTHHKYSWGDGKLNGVKVTTKDAVTNLNFVNIHGGMKIKF